MHDITILNELLNYWFGAAGQRNHSDRQHQQLWFSASHAQDAELGERWAALHLCAVGGELTHWHYTPQARLGLILLLDQFPRVLYRSTPQAFAYDGQALALCLAGIHAGQDQELQLCERAFFYMPLQHSEDIAAQQISVSQHQQLLDAFPDFQEKATGFLKYAQLHHDIIEKFGRFPHRNQILGREPTEFESEWLNGKDGHSFGQ